MKLNQLNFTFKKSKLCLDLAVATSTKIFYGFKDFVQ